MRRVRGLGGDKWYRGVRWSGRGEEQGIGRGQEQVEGVRRDRDGYGDRKKRKG